MNTRFYTIRAKNCNDHIRRVVGERIDWVGAPRLAHRYETKEGAFAAMDFLKLSAHCVVIEHTPEPYYETPKLK